MNRAVTEGDTWKLVLPESVIADMRKATPEPAANRYAPNTTASDGGVTARVVEVILEKDTTAVRLSVENVGTDEARLLNAFSLATLTDESGNSHNTRILRSTLPERVAARASVAVTLVFDPVPLTSQKLSLSLPGIGAGDRGLYKARHRVDSQSHADTWRTRAHVFPRHNRGRPGRRRSLRGCGRASLRP